MKVCKKLLLNGVANMGGVMPVLFIGHGNPMNGVGDNEFSAGWTRVAASLPKPKAVLCISAHWETELRVGLGSWLLGGFEENVSGGGCAGGAAKLGYNKVSARPI